MIVTFNADEELIDALKSVSKEKGIDKSKLIRAILRKHLGLKDKKIA